jgi:hypothetical protein
MTSNTISPEIRPYAAIRLVGTAKNLLVGIRHKVGLTVAVVESVLKNEDYQAVTAWDGCEKFGQYSNFSAFNMAILSLSQWA